MNFDFHVLSQMRADYKSDLILPIFEKKPNQNFYLHKK